MNNHEDSHFIRNHAILNAMVMFSQKESLRTADSLHAKQAQIGGRGIKRSLIFVERAQCHKGHQLFIISEVLTEVKFTIKNTVF